MAEHGLTVEIEQWGSSQSMALRREDSQRWLLRKERGRVSWTFSVSVRPREDGKEKRRRGGV